MEETGGNGEVKGMGKVNKERRRRRRRNRTRRANDIKKRMKK